MTIRPEDVRHVAHLARLELDDSRLEVITRELGSILEHMEVLQRVDTTGVATTASVTDAGTPLRVDAGPPIPLERPIEEFAPEVRDGLFIVPRLATHGDEDSGRAP